MKTKQEYKWIWYQQCSLTGEVNEVFLTDEQKKEYEKSHSWEDGDMLVEIETEDMLNGRR